MAGGIIAAIVLICIVMGASTLGNSLGTSLPYMTVPSLGNSDLSKLKSDLANRHDEIKRLIDQNLVSEGPLGYLVDTERLDLTERQTVQDENVTREKVFSYIAKQTGKSREEVASRYAAMVQQKASSGTSNDEKVPLRVFRPEASALATLFP
jgi:uncharacterized protein YdbL (DUF1318 family)